MKNFRLKVFLVVARRLSFTKAAEELYITQPAVSKHINAIEQELKIKLFERKGNHIELTEAGIILINYAQKIENLYEQLNFDLSVLIQKQKGKLRIGTSTTITQYVLPPVIANFHSKFRDISINVVNGNTEQIERALRKNEIDLGVIEGHSKRRGFHYLEYLKDKIVFAVRSSHPAAKKNKISLKDLQNLPLIVREKGSGTLEVIAFHLKEHNLTLNDFNIELQFGSTEGIKNYILNSDTVAVLSIHSIAKELQRNELSILDVNNLIINRYFNFIFPEGHLNPIANLFIKFALHYNF